jgi:hypothetical protein
MTSAVDVPPVVFNSAPAIHFVPIAAGHHCVVVDNALSNPETLVEWARGATFLPPRGYPYPGLVLEASRSLTQGCAEFFATHVRKHLGARRTLDLTCRLSLVTLAPEQLAPVQWLCHRDRIAADPHATLFAASVLYLFREPALGGTSFYVPRQTAAQTDQLVADSQCLGASDFSKRYRLEAGYMKGSNAYFEHVAGVPAAWNRMVFYDGGLFHSADVDGASLLADPSRGRLTLNGFYTCRRNAR